MKKEVMKVNFKLKPFDMPIVVSRLANVHYFELTNDFHTETDSHNFFELLYVDKGKVNVRSEGFEGDLSAGQLIIHMPDEAHSFICASSSAPNLIIIGFECKGEELAPLSKKAMSLTAAEKKLLAEIIKEGMSVYAPPYDIPNIPDMQKREEYPFGADHMIKLRLETLLILLVRDWKMSKKTEKYKRKIIPEVFDVYQYLNEHYTEKITLDNLSFIFGTNKTTLCKSFKEKYGTTVVEFINGLRISRARELLGKSEMSVTEISEALGFSSVHYFCRIFKSKVGRSPKEYAENLRKNKEI